MKSIKKYTASLALFLCAVVFVSKGAAPQSWRDLVNKVPDAARSLGVDSGAVKTLEAITRTTVGLADAKKAADSLTPENEYYLGRAVAADIAGRYSVYNNPALQAYLNKICNTIVINSPRPDIYRGYHVAVLDTDEINAFATPGGHIFVTRGLIACASTEDALAAVIAHEIAHIQLRHALESITSARYVNAVVSGAASGVGEYAGDLKGITDAFGESINDMITTMVVKGFSPRQELEADTTALSLLAAAGYQPTGILEMLRALDGKQQGGQGFGKTHPSPAARIANVNKNIGKYAVADTSAYRTSRFGKVKR
ncbi:MAG: M48 family metalloprotease [Treponema sp.]|jgi:predicted Zn-dependent protease|nr:M48 family metalloprotease [Treponema sp.]